MQKLVQFRRRQQFLSTLELSLVMMIGCSGCSNWTSSNFTKNNLPLSDNTRPIREILAIKDPGVTLSIQGKVEKQIPLIKQMAYQIKDSTGKIWVITHQHNLGVGQQVVFKGKIMYKSIPLASQEYGEVYLEEE
jgi:hypothetical protein